MEWDNGKGLGPLKILVAMFDKTWYRTDTLITTLCKAVKYPDIVSQHREMCQHAK